MFMNSGCSSAVLIQTHSQAFAAHSDKARELSQLASADAVGQAMHKAHPENPFVQ